MEKEIFVIEITASEFGSRAKFYKRFAKGNRTVLIEQVEFEDTDEQHNCGILTDTIVCKPSELKEKVKQFIEKNTLQQECFSIKKDGIGKVIMTEDNL